MDMITALKKDKNQLKKKSEAMAVKLENMEVKLKKMFNEMAEKWKKESEDSNALTLQSALAAFQRGTISFKVTQFKLYRIHAEIFYSQPFYSINGYNMRVEVHPYGYGESKGTHVSIFVRVIKGHTLKYRVSSCK